VTNIKLKILIYVLNEVSFIILIERQNNICLLIVYNHLEVAK